MAEATFEVNVDPHVATIGTGDNATRYEFHPEVSSAEYLDAWVEMHEAIEALGPAPKRQRAGAPPDPDNPGPTPAETRDRTAKVTAITDAFVSRFMLDESAERYREVSANMPDRVKLALQQWILGVYGGRPTSPPNGSLQPSPAVTPGVDSIGTSPVEAPTP